MDSLKWKPQRITLQYITSTIDAKINWYKFRDSSSSYISKKKVRDYILSNCNYKCVECGSGHQLQIDHVKSVLNCFLQRRFFECNTVENLQVLCSYCNNKKSHY